MLQVLAGLLFAAADEGYVNADKVQQILGISRDQALGAHSGVSGESSARKSAIEGKLFHQIPGLLSNFVSVPWFEGFEENLLSPQILESTLESAALLSSLIEI